MKNEELYRILEEIRKDNDLLWREHIYQNDRQFNEQNNQNNLNNTFNNQNNNPFFP